MTRSSQPSAVLAELLPDELRWIDLRGLLISGRCDIWAESKTEDGFVARSWDYPFAALCGDPSPDLLLSAVAKGREAIKGQYLLDEWQLLAPPESRATVEAALPDWRSNCIHLLRWEGSLDQPTQAFEGEIVLLRDGHRQESLSLEHVPETTRQELTLDWVSNRPMSVAIVDSLPVSFCYAAFTTERLWDVSIETLRPHRRRGLAAATVLRLTRHMAELGKIPAWGAMDNNPASLGLAAKLGFVHDSQVDGWFEQRPKAP